MGWLSISIYFHFLTVTISFLLSVSLGFGFWNPLLYRAQGPYSTFSASISIFCPRILFSYCYMVAIQINSEISLRTSTLSPTFRIIDYHLLTLILPSPILDGLARTHLTWPLDVVIGWLSRSSSVWLASEKCSYVFLASLFWHQPAVEFPT